MFLVLGKLWIYLQISLKKFWLSNYCSKQKSKYVCLLFSSQINWMNRCYIMLFQIFTYKKTLAIEQVIIYLSRM